MSQEKAFITLISAEEHFGECVLSLHLPTPPPLTVLSPPPPLSIFSLIPNSSHIKLFTTHRITSTLHYVHRPTGGFDESNTGIIRLVEQSSEIVSKVAEYLMYKEKYEKSNEDAPDFQERVNSNMALELLMASDFLEC
ncbi:hypothetical protein P7C70_g5807, partial [Phenoliferia sp. Uapishka_3]